jgi:hypothetical protein
MSAETVEEYKEAFDRVSAFDIYFLAIIAVIVIN